jgi:AraC-like DNA-binding protein
MFGEKFVLGPKSKELVVTKNDAPLFVDFAIRVAGYTEIHDEYLCARKCPKHYTLVVNLAGQGELFTEDEGYLLQPGSMAVVKSQQSFCYQAVDGHWQFMWFILEQDPAWFFLEDLPTLQQHSVPGQVIKPMLVLLSEAISIATKRSLTREIVQHLMTALRPQVPTTSLGERLARLFMAVDQQLHFPWTATELARRLYCSPPTLHRYCLRLYGQSPMQIVIGLRMQRTRVLLEETEWSLDIIAAQLGYSSGLSLSKVFKQKMAQSPSSFRRRLGM